MRRRLAAILLGACLLASCSPTAEVNAPAEGGLEGDKQHVDAQSDARNASDADAAADGAVGAGGADAQGTGTTAAGQGTAADATAAAVAAADAAAAGQGAAAVTVNVVRVEPQAEGSALPAGFSYIDPSILCEIRYATSFNFVGDPIDGYLKPVGIATDQANAALAKASLLAMDNGLRLKVFDAYRPWQAHEHFIRWGADLGDTRMKAFFYPNTDKSQLFKGYIAYNSDPHSRGSTVDLTLVDMASGAELDMGTHYDLLGPQANYYYSGISDEQRRNRATLREIMLASGFIPYDGEWWDFTLADEPYPSTYFDFPVA
jgi:D-alanyl-D-alanine dipeptidase